jgi:hypothetical protein
MKKMLIPVLLGVCLVSLICPGCSRTKDGEQEKGSIEKFTEKTGQDAADAIKKPINRAKDIDALAQERIKNLEKQDDEKGE